MKMLRLHLLRQIFGMLLLIFNVSWSVSAATDPTQIEHLLKESVDVGRNGVGIVVGVVDATGARYYSFGVANLQVKNLLNSDSIFEIGSVTKTFTALLLADMVVRGEVKLSDPISKYLPKHVKVPQKNNKQITLLDLATHRSGLPRNVDGYPKTAAEPTYAGLTVAEMYQFLSSYQLTRDIGEDAEYSNLGAGLLGHVLSLRAGESYETLIKKRILEPLKMKNTAISLTKEMAPLQAQGYNKSFLPAKPFEIPVLEGAGALRSSPNDLMRYVQANLGLTDTPLDQALQLVHQVSEQSYGQKLAWGTWTENGTEYTNHGGTTFAFKTYILLDFQHQRGVVVMANSALTDVEKIAEKILIPQSQ